MKVKMLWLAMLVLDCSLSLAEVLPDTVDIGTVYEGEAVERDVPVVTDRASEILSVRKSCGCTDVDYPDAVLQPGREEVITVGFDAKGRSGPFLGSVVFDVESVGDGIEANWGTVLRGEVVVLLPKVVRLGAISARELPRERAIELGQINDRPARITDVVVEGRGIRAMARTNGRVLLLRSDPALTWGENIRAKLRVSITIDGQETVRVMEVWGSVKPRLSIVPPTLSFGMGLSTRREQRQIVIEVTDTSIKSEEIKISWGECEGPRFHTAATRKSREKLVLIVQNLTDFPVGLTECVLHLTFGGEMANIPVFALSE